MLDCLEEELLPVYSGKNLCLTISYESATGARLTHGYIVDVYPREWNYKPVGAQTILFWDDPQTKASG